MMKQVSTEKYLTSRFPFSLQWINTRCADKPLYSPNILGPVVRSLVSANRWLRDIKTYRFPWYLTLVSNNHVSSNPGLACVSQKTRKLLGAESFSGLFSGYFLGSRKVFLKAPGNSPDSKRTFRDFSRVGAWPPSGGD